MHSAVAGLKPEQVASTLAFAALQADKSRVGMAERPQDKISISSWARFGLYSGGAEGSLAFEPHCPPVRVCFPYAREGVNCLLTIMPAAPGPTHSGHTAAQPDAAALEVHMALLEADMQRLLADPLLHQYAD